MGMVKKSVIFYVENDNFLFKVLSASLLVAFKIQLAGSKVLHMLWCQSPAPTQVIMDPFLWPDPNVLVNHDLVDRSSVIVKAANHFASIHLRMEKDKNKGKDFRFHL